MEYGADAGSFVFTSARLLAVATESSVEFVTLPQWQRHSYGLSELVTCGPAFLPGRCRRAGDSQLGPSRRGIP